MKKTATLGMNLFESGDPVKAEFFNQNTEILETHITQKVGVASGTFAPLEYDGRITLTFDRKPLMLFIISSYGIAMCSRGSNGISVSRSEHVLESFACTWGNYSINLAMRNNTSTAVLTGDTVHYFVIVE